jgi:O-antigen/teichoic acid export membrane protein
VQQAALRFYPVHASNGEARGFVRCTAWLGMASGLIASVLIVVALWAGFGGAVISAADLVPAAALTFFTVAGAGRASLLQATFALTRFSVVTSVGAILKFALPLMLLTALQPFEALLWGTALAAFVSWVALMAQRPSDAWRSGPSWGIGKTIAASREAASFGLPLSVSEIGVQVLQFSDRWAVAALLGPAAVGLYGTNYSIAEKLVILVQAPLIYAAHSPIVSAWERGDRGEVASLIRTALRWLVIFGAPLVAFTAVRADLISSLLLGEEYASGHVVIPVAAASILLYAACQYGHKTFELGKRTWIMTSTLLVAAICNAVGVVALILAVGYLGGALGTAVGYGAYAVLVYVLSRRRGSAFHWQVPWRTLVVCAAGGVLACLVWSILVPDRVRSPLEFLLLVGSGIAGLGAYGAVLLLSGELPAVGGLVRAKAWHANAWSRKYGQASRSR